MNSKNEKRIGFLLNVFAVIFLVTAGLLYFYRSQTIETQWILYENHFDSPEDLNRFLAMTGVGINWNVGRPPEVIIALSTDTVHSAPYSCRIELLKPWGGTTEEQESGLYRRVAARIDTENWKEFYAFAWHYFKSPFANTRPISLMAVKEIYLGQPEKSWRLNIRASLSDFHKIGMWKQEFNGKVPNYTDLRFELPLDTWFRTGVYVKKHKTDGII